MCKPYFDQIKKIKTHLSVTYNKVNNTAMLQAHSLFSYSFCMAKHAANLLGFKTLHYRHTITTCNVLNVVVITLQSFELFSQTIPQINLAKLQYQCALSYARQSRRIFWTPADDLGQRQHLILVRKSFLVSSRVASDTPVSTHICSTSLRTFLLDALQESLLCSLRILLCLYAYKERLTFSVLMKKEREEICLFFRSKYSVPCSLFLINNGNEVGLNVRLPAQWRRRRKFLQSLS